MPGQPPPNNLPVASSPLAGSLSGRSGNLQHERFLAELARRKENLTQRGKAGRCKRCGDTSGPWSYCPPCRVKKREYEARFNPPGGEHFPTPAPSTFIEPAR